MDAPALENPAPLGHAYSYYNPYYYYDTYPYGYGQGGDALGFVMFFIFLIAIMFCVFWGWGDDQGCTTPGYNNKTVHKTVHKHVYSQPPPLAPKPTAPPAIISAIRQPKLKIPVQPYRALNVPPPENRTVAVAINTPLSYWTEDQLKLIGAINTVSFFKMLQREITIKLKARRNPREIAAQLIAVRMRLEPTNRDVKLLKRYIKMRIFNVQASDIKVLSSPELRLLAIDIIARLSGYPNGYIDLPEKIMYWVTDFVSI
jgi:hypothetical protein